MKYEISFEGGEGRYTTKAVNYMMAEVNGVELYAEVVLPDEDVADDYGYEELKAEILEQAAENNIPADTLHFWYD